MTRIRVRGVGLSPISEAQWLATGSLAARGGQLLVLLVVATRVSPSAYGVFALTSAIVALGNFAAESGITQATSSHPTISVSEERALVGYALVWGSGIFFAELLVAFLFARNPQFGDAVPFTLYLGVTTVATAVTAVSLGRLQRVRRYRTLGVAQVLASFLSLVVAVALVIAGLGVVALVLQTVTQVLAFSAVVLLHRESRIAPSRRIREARTVRQLARFALFANLLSVSARRVDDLLVGAILGAAALGQYNIAYRCLTVANEVFIHSTERTVLTRLAELRHESLATALRFAGRAQRRLMVTVGPVFLAIGVIGYVGFPRVLGARWTTAGRLTLILCTAGAVQSIYFLLYCTLFVLASPRRALIYQVAMTALLFLGIGVGLIGGTYGVAFGIVGASVMGLPLSVILQRRYLTLRRGANAVEGAAP